MSFWQTMDLIVLLPGTFATGWKRNEEEWGRPTGPPRRPPRTPEERAQETTHRNAWLTDTDVTVDSPAAITRTHLLDYLAHLAGMGRSGVTRARKLAAMREYFQFLVDEKSLALSPAQKITRPKRERKQRVFLRVDEYMRLLNAAAGNSRDYAILQVFLQTGLRVSELVGLELTDLDLCEGSMLVNGKGQKQRTIYLEKKATQAFRSYLKDRPRSADQHVFLNYHGNGLSVQGVMDLVEKYRTLAGISKKFSCHSLRHTCATYKAGKGYTPRELQDLLARLYPNQAAKASVWMKRSKRSRGISTMSGLAGDR